LAAKGTATRGQPPRMLIPGRDGPVRTVGESVRRSQPRAAATAAGV